MKEYSRYQDSKKKKKVLLSSASTGGGGGRRIKMKKVSFNDQVAIMIDDLSSPCLID
jgi:hypothetical protein